MELNKATALEQLGAVRVTRGTLGLVDLVEATARSRLTVRGAPIHHGLLAVRGRFQLRFDGDRVATIEAPAVFDDSTLTDGVAWTADVFTLTEATILVSDRRLLPTVRKEIPVIGDVAQSTREILRAEPDSAGGRSQAPPSTALDATSPETATAYVVRVRPNGPSWA